jgi:hypothetical protein
MTTKVFYAVDLRLWRITAKVDAQSGARIAGGAEAQQLAAHYDGSLTEAQAQELYAACDAVLCDRDEGDDGAVR